MQTLGLSDSTARSESRLKSLFWPSIQSGADVDYLAVQGFWVCTIVGLMSFIFAGVLSGQPIIGFLVLLLFHIGGVGVREHNPYAATIVLIYYLIDFFASLVLLFATSPGIGVVKVIVIALLLSNLRATWIASGWKPESEEAALPPRLGETFFDKLADEWPAFIWPKVKWLYYIFSFGYLVLTVAGLIVMAIRGRV
jgi:hypothetical protein